MKKIYFLLILACGFSNAQIVNIPDANFKAAIIAGNPSIDADGDGEIQLSDALAATYLSATGPDISDLTGLEVFTNLTWLILNGTSVTSIDLSPFTSLTRLNIGGNQLTALDVSALVNLVDMNVGYNNLTALDVSSLTGLQFLNCSFNGLSSIDLSNNTELKELIIKSNQLTSLDLSLLSNLEDLDFGSNQITSIDISQLPNLATIFCSWNQLATLDCSNNPNLYSVICQYNGMQTLFIKNGAVEANPVALLFGNNLQFICADESEIPAVQNALTENGFDATVVNSYCNFTPGGNHNTISGTLKYDPSNDGCDITDATIIYGKINLSDGISTGSSFINAAGFYNFYTPAGSYTIEPAIENPAYFIISPENSNVAFADDQNNSASQNFCVAPNGNHPDLEIVIMPTTPARPGFDANYEIAYKNKGTEILTGTISLEYDSLHIQYLNSSLPPVSQSAGFIAFNFSSLEPFASGNIQLSFHVNSPTDPNAVNINDILNFDAAVNSVPGIDETPADNVFSLHQTVIGSYDPNTKECLEGSALPSTEIGKYIHYIINFENTGTAAAENIVVVDLIDTEKYDISSLQVMNASHPVDIKITGNKVEFIFEDINLPSRIAEPIGGHGNVLFKIKTLPTLNAGDIVDNTANIYFDYNAPITTNTARTTFAQLSSQQFANDDSILIYPNPVMDKVKISAKSELKSIEIYDVAGRILEKLNANKNPVEIDFSSKAKGIYFFKINTSAGSKIEKIIKQ